MGVFKGSAGGTIHFKTGGPLSKTACGMPHDPRMSWTDERDKTSCPQCMREYPLRSYARGKPKRVPKY